MVDDGVLMAELASSECDAVAELYRRYERPLLAYARRRLHDRMAAEELVHETLLGVWRMSGRFDVERGSVDCLVFTIASRVLVDILRRQRRTVPVVELGPGVEPMVDDHAADRASAVAVRAAMAQLSNDHRTVLGLVYFDGLTQREAAAVLGIPLGTVKTRTYWALRALHAALAEDPDRAAA
jgi:RNA polymerase sigma-70 factor (ECF subfamily)